LRAGTASHRNKSSSSTIVPDDSREGCPTHHGDEDMKTMILALAAVAALAGPALAHPAMHAQRGGASMRGIDAQAMAPTGDTVYANGANLGSDPDPQVRLQLLKSAGLGDR
jgi:hypothetical protein